MTSQEVIAAIRTHQGELFQRFGVRSLSLFGSVARSEQSPNSDVDLLVEFHRPTGLFAFFTLQDELEELLHSRVDLATIEGLKPEIRGRVMSESVNVLTTVV